MKRVKHQIIVEKPVDNYVENFVDYSQNTISRQDLVNIHTFIITIWTTFPLIFAEKRYKLINFAPKKDIVDK